MGRLEERTGKEGKEITGREREKGGRGEFNFFWKIMFGIRKGILESSWIFVRLYIANCYSKIYEFCLAQSACSKFAVVPRIIGSIGYTKHSKYGSQMYTQFDNINDQRLLNTSGKDMFNIYRNRQPSQETKTL